MKVLAVVKWILILLLLTVVTVGGAGLLLWKNSDSLVERQILARFAELSPDLILHLDATRLLSPTLVELRGVEIRERATHRPLFRAADLQVVLDETELFERQLVLIRSVRMRTVDVVVQRQTDGRWNWQSYRFAQTAGPALVLPSVSVEDVRVKLLIDHGAGRPSVTLPLASELLQAVPASSRSFDFSGDINVLETAVTGISGNWNLADRTWEVRGRVRGVQAGQRLVELAQSANPELTTRLADLDSAIAARLPVPPGSDDSDSETFRSGHKWTPRLLGLLDVDFRATGNPETPVPDFLLKVGLRDGQLALDGVPETLTRIQATIFWDNQNFIGRLNEAYVDEARLSGQIQLATVPAAARPPGNAAFAASDRSDIVPGTASLRVERLLVNQRLRPFCPPAVQRFLDHFQPDGHISGEVELRQAEDGRWLPANLSATVEDGAVVYHRFRYPVTGISGTITQRATADGEFRNDNVYLDLTFAGQMGNRPISARGVIRNPGPAAEISFDLETAGVTVDSRFRDALDDAGRKVLDALSLTGTLEASARTYRPPGPDQPTSIVLDGRVAGGSLKFRHFPYEIDQLSGRIQFDSRSRLWIFENLEGRHGDGQLTGRGRFRGLPGPGVLDLEITARGAALDADLYNALGAAQRRAWSLLDPSGKIHLTMQLNWTASPGQRVVVRLPQAEIYDAEVFPRPFPYRMKIHSADFSFDPNAPEYAGRQRCELRSLKAEHEGAPITASGWFEISPDQFWQLHINDLNARNIVPDDKLREALPDSWRDTLQRLAQTGQISVESSQLDFRGRTEPDAATTAAWDINLSLNDGGVDAGLRLEHVSGQVTARGDWDGTQLNTSGEIRMDTVDVLGMSLNRISGPFQIAGDEFQLGSREVFVSDPSRVPAAAQIHGFGYGGSVLLNGLISLRPGNGYRLFGTVSDARLETYAARHLTDQKDLRGNVNAWLYLTGTGDSDRDAEGRGQLLVSDASLYELPLMVKLLGALSQLNFSVPNQSAFDWALLSFRVRDRMFEFDPIDLVGDALALRGRGGVGFGGDVVLDFYSRPAQSRRPSIPLVNALVFTASTQWVGVEVRGTVNRPQTKVRATIPMDDSMKQFLSAFQPDPNGPVPRLMIPLIFGLPAPPQARRP